jgi:hypothetical protein
MPLEQGHPGDWTKLDVAAMERSQELPLETVTKNFVIRAL